MTLMVINELAGQGRPDAIQDVIYTDAALPRTPVAVLRVISEAASQGRPQAVVEARFSG
jgi:hypothetical protein